MSHIQIAIDGPSGAGKSSLSKAVAKAMGIIYVDTGALYRTVGYFARSRGITLDDMSALVPLLGEITIEVRYENEVQCVYLNGENLGDRIRENEISMYASGVSAIPEVRAFLLDTQKDIANKNSVIMDGRDIGTVILPNADVKIFLTASNEVRARRRVKELAEKGMPVSYEEVLADMIQRDEQDRSRDIAPAIAAPDAIHFDNSYEGFDEALNALLSVIQNALQKESRS
ncbi:MAG: (d)CMP kinase [Ruminococcaceae bacterium]|nr:(d)CMP kinase [Oscillospiraceae bacterium]